MKVKSVKIVSNPIIIRKDWNIYFTTPAQQTPALYLLLKSREQKGDIVNMGKSGSTWMNY